MTQAKHIQKLLLGVDPYYKISILGMTILDDQLFDKLLGSVSTVKPYSGTRKKYYKPKNAKTKKA